MDGVTIVWVLLGIMGIVLGIVLVVTLLQVRKSLQSFDVRLAEAMRQFDLTAEDIRKTNAVVREIMASAERSAANIEHVTEGVRGFRSTLDAATSVLRFAVVPVLGNTAAGIAGVKAGLSYVLNRWFRKEGGHE